MSHRTCKEYFTNVFTCCDITFYSSYCKLLQRLIYKALSAGLACIKKDANEKEHSVVGGGDTGDIQDYLKS
jgi:hypothetical protein